MPMCCKGVVDIATVLLGTFGGAGEVVLVPQPLTFLAIGIH